MLTFPKHSRCAESLILLFINGKTPKGSCTCIVAIILLGTIAIIVGIRWEIVMRSHNYLPCLLLQSIFAQHYLFRSAFNTSYKISKKVLAVLDVAWEVVMNDTENGASEKRPG